MTKFTQKHIKENLPYFGSISRKYRYKGANQAVKDKAWSLLSDYVRCRDFIKYGTCVATGNRIIDWRESDAGHFYTMSGHGALIGFDDMNVHMQSKNSNQLSSAADGAEFERTLIDRYGEGIIKHLRAIKMETVKADDLFFIKKIQEIWPKFRQLRKDYPDHTYPDYLLITDL